VNFFESFLSPTAPHSRMSVNLTEGENAILGAAAGVIEVTMLQSMNYWKNASQQGLPWSWSPKVLYRGYSANVLNMGGVTCFQFVANGWVSKMMTGGVARPMSPSEQIQAGFVAGAASAFVCGPLELVMIQQQRKGGSILQTFTRSVSNGSILRGIIPTSGREGIYTAGYMGVVPSIRNYLKQNHPETIGKTDDRARIVGSVVGGFLASSLSHALDTTKTCMQGDVERKQYGNIRQTFAAIHKERGFAGFFRGLGWRMGRQICAIFIMDKTRVTVAPYLFPQKFKD